MEEEGEEKEGSCDNLMQNLEVIDASFLVCLSWLFKSCFKKSCIMIKSFLIPHSNDKLHILIFHSNRKLARGMRYQGTTCTTP